MARKASIVASSPPALDALAGATPLDVRVIALHFGRLADWLEAEMAKRPAKAQAAGRYAVNYIRDSSNQLNVLVDYYAQHET